MQSIDIFDTAIFRDVYEPKDIFKLVEIQLGQCFSEKRIMAENLARQEVECYSYHDIYRHLPEFQSHKDVEIQIEVDHCYANPKILEMYNKDPDNYIFISDMYLSSEFLEKLLAMNGYINPKVYVSCEWKGHKGNGTLFEKVIKEVGPIEKHYGDNYLCDVVQAKKNGISPVFLPSLQNRKLQLPVVKNPMLKKYLAETYEKPPLEKLALWFAPLLYNFTKWVVETRVEGQKLFFLSRDMYIPYLIAKDVLKEKNVYYLHASRRSLAPLILQKSSNQRLKDKIKLILSPEEIKAKEKEDLTSCINYFKNMNIEDGDIVVDIGYSGTVQEALKCLDIHTCGLYLQVNENPYSVILDSYFKRPALQYLLLMEFPLCSDEDSVEGYKDDKPFFVPDIEQRKQYSLLIKDIIFNSLDRIKKFRCDSADLEQVVINLQYYPDQPMLDLFNSCIFTNRAKIESGIGFDKEKIMNGDLINCYERSYARPLFKKLLEQDKEISYLSRMLP